MGQAEYRGYPSHGNCRGSKVFVVVRLLRFLGWLLPVALSLLVVTSVAQATSPSPHVSDPCDGPEVPVAAQVVEPVTFGRFVAALGAQFDALDPQPLQPAWEQFVARRGIDPQTPGLLQDFRRLRWLYEATRDGGWWQLRWDITNQEPSSRRIFTQWERVTAPVLLGEASAVAECDEVSSLYALLGRRLGVRGIGLFYPTWNHTIAAWAPPQLVRKHSRIVLIPTTQIFLGCEAGFDQTTFRTGLTNIEEYPRWDIRDSRVLPIELARYLLAQVRAYGDASPELSELMRATRAFLMGSSMGDCNSHRQALAAHLASKLTCGDRRALRHFAATELGVTVTRPEAALALLGWSYGAALPD
jgi:hypothetical protein